MGVYINPETMSKEDWLDQNAKPISVNEFMENGYNFYDNREEFILIWIDNGQVTALLVVHGLRIYKYLVDQIKSDKRPMKIYTAHKETVFNTL